MAPGAGAHLAFQALGDDITLWPTRGEPIELPQNHWIIVDTASAVWPRCDVLLVGALSSAAGPRAFPVAQHLAGPRVHAPAAFRAPLGSWAEVGRIRDIWYTRPDQGPKVHTFRKGFFGRGRADLWREIGGSGYLLKLSGGCNVSELGFVFP